jgi:hypothetical protein
VWPENDIPTTLVRTGHISHDSSPVSRGYKCTPTDETDQKCGTIRAVNLAVTETDTAQESNRRKTPNAHNAQTGAQ